MKNLPERVNDPNIPNESGSILVDRVARPIANDRGRLVGASAAEQLAFWRFFQDSAAVDDAGKPVMVFHGTARDFSKFDEGSQGSTFDHLDLSVPKEGFWFTSCPSNAAWYSGYSGQKAGGEGAYIIPVYLSLKNPFRISAETHAEQGLMDFPTQSDLEQLGHDGIIMQVSADAGVNVAADAFQLAMFEKYPGKNSYQWSEVDRKHYVELLDEPVTTLHTHYVAFRPEQIKSAIGNCTYDPSNPYLTDREYIGPEITQSADKLLEVARAHAALSLVGAADLPLRAAGKMP